MKMTFRQLNLFAELANDRLRAMHGGSDAGRGRGKPKL